MLGTLKGYEIKAVSAKMAFREDFGETLGEAVNISCQPVTSWPLKSWKVRIYNSP